MTFASTLFALAWCHKFHAALDLFAYDSIFDVEALYQHWDVSYHTKPVSTEGIVF